MTTLVVTSDLHLGITSEATVRALAQRIAAEQPDLTVLAGDLGEGLTNFRRCLALFASLPGQVAVLAGNHDVWATEGVSSLELWEHALPQATRDAGMLWLEERPWCHGALAVAGSLAWYDYSAVDPSLAQVPRAWFAANKGHYMIDAQAINWPWSDVEFATRLGDGLCATLAQLEADPAVRAVVVITHVPLFEAQMVRKPSDVRWSRSNAYFGNLTLGRRVLESTTKLVRVVSGHTHNGRSGFVPASRQGTQSTAPIPVSVLASDYGAPLYAVYRNEDLTPELGGN
jgi:predicted phosphohydrolase